jgi:cytochrome c1
MTQASRIARIATLAAAFGAASLAAGAAFGASEGTHVERQRWSFSGVFGQYDQAQLQRGYQVYSEVCANCHELRRIHYRNLAQPGGPAFPKDAVAALAASVEVEDGPDDQGKMFQRPGRLSDRLPQRYKNEQEARSIHNGAYPPDLSLMVRARNVETTAPWYIHPFLMLKDIATANQDGGADYVRALLTGYKDRLPGVDSRPYAQRAQAARVGRYGVPARYGGPALLRQEADLVANRPLMAQASAGKSCRRGTRTREFWHEGGTRHHRRQRPL